MVKLPAIKQQPVDESMLSFVPAGMPRKIAEYLVSSLLGAMVLAGFFAVSELSVLLFPKNNFISLMFLPIVCAMPFVVGALAALVLEKIKKRPITIKQAAIAGSLAGFLGSSFSAMFLAASWFLFPKVAPFGESIPQLLSLLLLPLIVFIDTLLAAVGAVIVAKFANQ
ncbi:MAG: hypothetical protein QXT25_00570 [Candidatus Anstonellaceae archaeon]